MTRIRRIYMLWAQSLLVAEALNDLESTSHMPVAVRVSERLRVYLTRVIGIEGFIAMQRRALALARTNVPSLQTVNVAADGRLEGFEELGGAMDGSASALTAHLLELLVTFIGESATLRLVSDAFQTQLIWSEESEDLK